MFVSGWCNFKHSIFYFSERSTYPVPSLWYQSWHLILCPCCEISHLCCFHLGARLVWIEFLNYCYKYHLLIVVVQERVIFKFYVQYPTTVSLGSTECLPGCVWCWQWWKFGCSLECLWLGIPLFKGHDQDGVKYFLNHPEGFLTVPI